MKKIRIGIVGGTGGIGRRFAGFFQDAGFPVRTAGRASAPDLPAMARESDILIVSVPIDATPDMIRRVGPHVRGDGLEYGQSGHISLIIPSLCGCNPSRLIRRLGRPPV